MSNQQETTQPLSENQASQKTTPQEESYQIKNISHNNFWKSKKIGAGLLAILLVVGVSLSISSAMHQTNLQEHASGPEPTAPPHPVLNPNAITNINSITATLATINPDGTMGHKPQLATGQMHYQLSLKGNLSLQ